ncbi:hypothetical protein ScPMuIL_005110 [Solemya velum]
MENMGTMSLVCRILCCVILTFTGVCGYDDKVIPDGVIPPTRPGEVRFGPPSLNEEEEHSWHVPESLQCDACRILSYRTFSFRVFVYILVNFAVVNGEGIRGVKQAPDGKSGELRFTPPDLDDEDAHSVVLPDIYKCDGCRLLAFRMTEALKNAEAKMKPTQKKLYESQILDALDQVCTDKFESTGVKEINGEKRLSSRGLETFDAPGIMQGGGMWPGRLQNLCGRYTGDLDEDDIYKAYRKEKDLDRYLCYGRGLRGYCNQKKTELENTTMCQEYPQLPHKPYFGKLCVADNEI